MAGDVGRQWPKGADRVLPRHFVRYFRPHRGTI